MPKKASTTWSGGSIKLDTADKKQLIAHPQQQHNLSLAPNRNVLLWRTRCWTMFSRYHQGCTQA